MKSFCKKDLLLKKREAALKKNNDNVGAGYIEKKGQQFLMRAPGQLKTNEDIERVVVKTFDGVPVTSIDTLYGKLNFVMEPLLRGPWANHAVAIDLDNVSYRPLVGNGESRDTQIMTNVQANDVDGRKDMILTEAGLEISLPETHAVLKFN